MSKTFDSVAHGYYAPFGGLTPEQLDCKAFTASNLTTLLHVRQREKFVREVQVCCCGYGPADEDEPMLDSHFSQFQFYRSWIEEVVYFHDKFDFIIKSVANGVCKVEAGFSERYVTALLDVLTFRDTTVPESPSFVLDLRQPTTPRICAEIAKTYDEKVKAVDHYVRKGGDYTGANAARQELQLLLDAQEEAEARRLRGEEPEKEEEVEASVNANPPESDADAKKPPSSSSVAAQKEEDVAAAALIEKYQSRGLDVLRTEEDEADAQRTPLLNMLIEMQQEANQQPQLVQPEAADTPQNAAAKEVEEHERMETTTAPEKGTAASEGTE